ncbi:MAG: T9SS type A sorting domain-containing protein [Saprospiraceae bacterium]
MKNSIFIFFFLILQIVCFGQDEIQWERAATPDSSYRVFEYFSKSGTLLYKDFNTWEYYASYNYGDSWEKLDYPVSRVAVGISSVADPVFKEDNHNHIYFLGQEYRSIINSGNFSSSTQIIYKLDFLTREITVYHDNGFANSITDFDFLSNGDLIVVTRKDIRILDAVTKSEKFKKQVTISRGYLYLSKGYKNYIDIGGPSTATGFQEFNDSLEFIGNKIEFPYFTNLVYSKGRFFINGEYSDDGGKTWQKLNAFLAFDSKFNKGKNGYLFGLNNNQYVYSTDNGETSIVLYENDLSWVTCDSSGIFVKIPNKCTVNKIHQISFDEGANWKDFSCNINEQAYAFSVRAGTNGNLIAEDQCERYLSYKKIEDTWETGETRFGVNIGQYVQTVLPNGKILISDNSGDYLISETFDNIEICNFNKVHYGQVYLKNNKLFIIESGKTLHTSEDFLNIKTSKTFNNSNISQSFPTGNNKLIQKGSSGLRILDLTNNSTKQLPFNTSVAFESSYDGKNIYVLRLTLIGVPNRQALTFHNSSDEGNTFITDTLLINQGNISIEKFIVDHYGNIYILMRDKILASFNEGYTWKDITPKDAKIQYLTDMSISFDNYIYVSTSGVGIIRTVLPNSTKSKLVKVKAIRDENFNCFTDSGEVRPVTGVVISSDGRQRPLDSKGEAYMYFNTDSTTFSLNSNRNISEVCEKNILVQDYHPDSTIIFNVKVFEDCADLQLGLTIPLLRRCFENTFYGNIINNGNETSENGIIHITLDSFYLFKSSDLEVVSYTHPDLVLKIPDMEVGEQLSFHFLFNLSCDAALGQEHCISANTEFDNKCNQLLSRKNYKECRQNIGSYDPNDKTIFVDGDKDALYKSREDKIEYLIRFQNTGTDTAFNIRIEDIISPAFDISTLRPVVSSHDFTWEIKPNRILVVYFKDIMLVDSFKNEPGSNGFVKFEINLDSLNQPGDTLENEASIFFDFNEPIITNKVVTLYDFPNHTKNEIISKIYAIPNPTNSFVEIKGDFTTDQFCFIRVYDMYGKLISSEMGNTSNIMIDLGRLSSSLYIVEIKTKEHRYTCKVLKR